VLSTQTAFICKIQENVLKEGEKAQKVIIPSLVSIDSKPKKQKNAYP